jgi:hypothetical protein
MAKVNELKTSIEIQNEGFQSLQLASHRGTGDRESQGELVHKGPRSRGIGSGARGHLTNENSSCAPPETCHGFKRWFFMAYHPPSSKAPEAAAQRNTSRRGKIEFEFSGWSATAQENASQDATTENCEPLRLTDLAVQPNDSYSFEVWSGTRRVIGFHFDDMALAMQAANDMELLLPVVSRLLDNRGA